MKPNRNISVVVTVVFGVVIALVLLMIKSSTMGPVVTGALDDSIVQVSPTTGNAEITLPTSSPSGAGNAQADSPALSPVPVVTVGGPPPGTIVTGDGTVISGEDATQFTTPTIPVVSEGDTVPAIVDQSQETIPSGASLDTVLPAQEGIAPETVPALPGIPPQTVGTLAPTTVATTSTTVAVSAGPIDQATSFAIAYYTFGGNDTPEIWKARVGQYATTALQEKLVIQPYDEGITTSASTRSEDEGTGEVNDTSATVTLTIDQTQYDQGKATKTVPLRLSMILGKYGDEWLVARIYSPG